MDAPSPSRYKKRSSLGTFLFIIGALVHVLLALIWGLSTKVLLSAHDRWTFSLCITLAVLESLTAIMCMLVCIPAIAHQVTHAVFGVLMLLSTYSIYVFLPLWWPMLVVNAVGMLFALPFLIPIDGRVLRALRPISIYHAADTTQ